MSGNERKKKNGESNNPKNWLTVPLQDDNILPMSERNAQLPVWAGNLVFYRK
jgi:hypothetical protein